MEIGLFSCKNYGIEFCLDFRVLDLEYVDNIVLASGDPGRSKIFLDYQKDNAAMLSMCFTPSICGMSHRFDAHKIEVCP